MTFRHALLLGALTVLIASQAQAGGLPQPGDFYFMSRNSKGSFVGSHKLYLEYSKGMQKVQYCDRAYYVSSMSVAWTHAETKRGNTVQIEYNFGKGWRPICRKPQDQVTLSDIGIDMLPEEFLAQRKTATPVETRFSKISGVFNHGVARHRMK